MRKIWFVQLPRTSNILTWGAREVCHLYEKNGYEVKLVDFNNRIYKEFYNTDIWQTIEKFGILGRGKLPFLKLIKLFLEYFKDIKKDDIVVYSIFSHESREWFLLLNTFFKKKYNNIVCVGGNGCRDPGEKEFETIWGDRMLEYKLVDTVFLGVSIWTLQKFIDSDFTLRGKLFDQRKEFPKLGFLPKKWALDGPDRKSDPSYGSANVHGHAGLSISPGRKQVNINFTQGCVKKCTFCDVPLQVTQWVMRPAEEVVNEIDYYYDLIEATHYNFPDNMINGSDSNFKKWLELLYSWKEKKNIKEISWLAQLGIKPKRHFDDETFKLMNLTGARLAIGFDHPSDTVLDHMGKKYTWGDTVYFIKQCEKYNVRIQSAMWIVGYPTETKEDFNEYAKLINLMKQDKINCINGQQVYPCSMNKNSPLLDIVDHIDWNFPNDWYTTYNGVKLDRIERLKRKKQLDESLLTLGLNYFKYQTIKRRVSR